MRGYALGAYYPNRLDRNRDAWRMFYLVSAIKGGEIKKGFAKYCVNARERKISDWESAASNLATALDVIENRLSKRGGIPFAKLGITSPPLFVPMPSSDAVVGASGPIRWGPRELARRLGGTDYSEMLRFRTRPVAATRGGSRSADDIEDNLVTLLDRPPARRSALLIDDVVTSGGHVIGAARVLRKAGFDEVAVFAVGRTVEEPVAKPMAPILFELEDPSW